MARDRIIKLPKPLTKVNRDQLQFILEDYLGEAGTIRWELDRWYLTLAGKPIHPYQRVTENPQPQTHDERWIEVYVGGHISVITRAQDTYTNNVATGIAMVLLKFFNGKAEMGDWS